MKYTCEACGKVFEAPANKNRPRRFCDQDCYRLYRMYHPDLFSGGQFTKGHVPANKGQYFRNSPATEYKPGPRPEERAPLMSTTVRHRNRSTKERRWLKVGHPNHWIPYAHYVWMVAHGCTPLPYGKIIRHMDLDPLNDEPDNLRAITRRENAILNKWGCFANWKE